MSGKPGATDNGGHHQHHQHHHHQPSPPSSGGGGGGGDGDDSSTADANSPYAQRKLRPKPTPATADVIPNYYESVRQPAMPPPNLPGSRPLAQSQPSLHRPHNKSHNSSSTVSPFVFDFDSAQHSPYSQRHPAAGRKYRHPRYRNSNEADWTESSSSEMEAGADAASVDDIGDSREHIALPVELHRAQSMASLRSRRNPHYQGVRSLRARRVIDKSGERNVSFTNIPQRSWLFLKDFVTTLIDTQWRFVIALFAGTFFFCWFLFGLLWWLIAHAHGDLDFDPVTGVRLNDGAVPCVEGAFSFAGFLLLSIETQVSIGFGSKYPNEECPEAIFLMVVQVICGIALEGAMVGIVYAKMSRPSGRGRSREVTFSRKAVVCQRDGEMCLVFRVCDSRSSHVIGTQIQAYWFEERRSQEGESLRQFQHKLKLQNNGFSFLIFPTTLCHVIDAESPLYDLSAKDLLEKRFELVITLTGSSSSTGQMTQSRTSYLPRELLWGYRFDNLISYDRLNGIYQADYDKCDDLLQVDTPLCSARRLHEVLDDCRDFVKRQEAAAEQQLVNTTSSNTETQSSVVDFGAQNKENVERVQYRHLERLAEELEYRLSNHSLLMETGAVNGTAAARDGVILIGCDEDDDGEEEEVEEQRRGRQINESKA